MMEDTQNSNTNPNNVDLVDNNNDKKNRNRRNRTYKPRNYKKPINEDNDQVGNENIDGNSNSNSNSNNNNNKNPKFNGKYNRIVNQSSSNGNNETTDNIPINKQNTQKRNLKKNKSNSNKKNNNESNEESNFSSNASRTATNLKKSRTNKTGMKPPKTPVFRDFGPKSDSENLRIGLTTDLLTSAYECMICYDNILHKAKVWSCSTCFGVFHLKCIKSWASKSLEVSTTPSNPVFSQSTAQSQSNLSDLIFMAIQDSVSSRNAVSAARDVKNTNQLKWRCPGCQTEHVKIPNTYNCFCSKVIKPPTDHMHPHSCGNTCGKDRGCNHICPDRCHPGPCDACENIAPEVACYCGRAQLRMRCKDMKSTALTCGNVCGALLNCGKHRCTDICHNGTCKPCEIATEVKCKCGKETRVFLCGEEHIFDCENICNIPSFCNFHTCKIVCHEPHKSLFCNSDPYIVKTCYCGKMDIEDIIGHARTSCQEKIPSCNQLCGRSLECGHQCESICHEGPCLPCQRIVSVKCECGFDELTVPCSSKKNGGHKCNKMCTTSLTCKRHRCYTKCCTSATHYCGKRCDKELQCKIHTCTYECGHSAKCHPCYVGVSFETQLCHCGKTSVEPPIPCNAPAPKCPHPCIRQLPCGHEHTNVHNCHGDDVECPKCMIFVERSCNCGKTSMKYIPCSRLSKPSCGTPCNKFLLDCDHPCPLYCHTGPCTPEKDKRCVVCDKLENDYFDDDLFLDLISGLEIIKEYENDYRIKEEKRKLSKLNSIGHKRGVLYSKENGNLIAHNHLAERSSYFKSILKWDMSVEDLNKDTEINPVWDDNSNSDINLQKLKERMEANPEFRWDDDDNEEADPEEIEGGNLTGNQIEEDIDKGKNVEIVDPSFTSVSSKKSSKLSDLTYSPILTHNLYSCINDLDN